MSLRQSRNLVSFQFMTSLNIALEIDHVYFINFTYNIIQRLLTKQQCHWLQRNIIQRLLIKQQCQWLQRNIIQRLLIKQQCQWLQRNTIQRLLIKQKCEWLQRNTIQRLLTKQQCRCVRCILKTYHCSSVGMTTTIKYFSSIFCFINYNRTGSQVQLVSGTNRVVYVT
jgi:hypothetical protein